MPNWNGPYVEVYEPGNLTTRKEVTDNGRTVNTIFALDAEGSYGAGEFLGGSITVPIEQRDNYPLVEKGDIIYAYTFNTLPGGSGNIAPITQFIVTDIDSNENADGTGTIVYSGAGLSKELIRKVLRSPYISTKYSGTSGSYTQTYVFLDAAHAAAENFYNGGVIEIGGSLADITYYTDGGNRAYVENWRPTDIGSGSGAAYIIHHGKATDNLDQAISFSQTGWTNSIIGVPVTGTPGGSFHVVDGQTCLDMLTTIAKETGYLYRSLVRYTPSRELDWFDPEDTTHPSGLYLGAKSEFTEAELYADINKSFVISAQKLNSSRDRWSRLIVASADGITLHGLSPTEVTVPTGWSIDFDQSMVINSPAETGMSVYEIFEKAYVFDHLTAQSDTPEAILQTQIALFYAAVNKLKEKDSTNNSYSVRTVLLRDILVGQRLYMKYIRSVAGEVQFTVDKDLWIRKISLSANSSDGVRYVDLELGDEFLSAIGDGNKAAAAAIKKSNTSTGSIVFGTISPGGAGVTDHGLLLGLNDVADHPGYLLVDGTRELTGDLAVLAGKTIDGVDISAFKVLYDAHIADPDAHHDRASAGNHITLDGIGGQRINVTTTSNAMTNVNTVLQGDGLGWLTVKDLGINTPATGSGLGLIGDLDMIGNINVDGNLTFTGPQIISTTTGNLAINPGSGILDITAHLNFIGARDITTSSDGLRLYPTTDLSLVPKSSVIIVGDATYNSLIKSNSASSGFMGAGWSMSYDGHLDARSAYLEELHVTTFTMAQARVKAGQDWITPSGSYLVADFTVPAIGSSVSIYVEDAQGLEGIPIFGYNDHILVYPLDRSGGGLYLAKIWGQVTGYVDQGDGTQRWTFTTRNLGLASSGLVVKSGGVAVDFGQSGDGWINLNAIDPAGAPYVGLGRWYTNPYTASNIENPIRLGDMGGITGDRGVMGLFIGRADGPRFIADEHAIKAHGMGMSMYADSNVSTGNIRINAIKVEVDYGSGIESMRVNADVLTGTDPQGKALFFNVTKVGGTGTYESCVDDNPDSPDLLDYIYNTLYTTSGIHDASMTFALESMTSSFSNTEQIDIKIHTTVTLGVNTEMRLVAEIISSTAPDYAPYTQEVTLTTHDSAGGLYTGYLRPLKVMTEADWDDAWIRFHWYIVPVGQSVETIRLDPNVPYIAVGNPIPTQLWGETTKGFWVGRDGTDYKLRIGGGDDTSASPALLYSPVSGLQLFSATNHTTSVIKLDTAGNSFFNGLMTISTTGEIRQGTGTWGSNFAGIRMYNSSGIGRLSGYSGDSRIVSIDNSGLSLRTVSASADSWLKFVDSGDSVVGKISFFESSGLSISWMSFTNAGNYAAKSFQFDNNIYTTGFVYAATGLTASGTTAKLTVNQKTGTSVVVSLEADMMTNGTTQGMQYNNQYALFQPISTTNAGLRIKAASDGSAAYALQLVGSADATNATHTSTGSVAPLILQGEVDNAAVGESNNAIIMRTGVYTRLILSGNGQVWNYYATTMTTFDDEEDDVLLRQFEMMISPNNILERSFDQFIERNDNKLVALGIVDESRSGFVNSHKLTMLQIGAATQHGQKLREHDQQFDTVEAELAWMRAQLEILGIGKDL